MNISEARLQKYGRSYVRQNAGLTTADKGFIDMGGFVGDLIISRKLPDLPGEVIDHLRDKLAPEEDFVRRLSEIATLNKRVRTLYRKNLDAVCMKNDWSKWKYPRKLEDAFTKWFLERSIELRYTDRHDDYLVERYHIDLFAGGDLKKETMRLFEKLEPLELIIYCALHQMSYQYLSDTERLASQLNADPIFIEIVGDYLDDNVDHYIDTKEYMIMDETLRVSESDMKIKC